MLFRSVNQNLNHPQVLVSRYSTRSHRHRCRPSLVDLPPARTTHSLLPPLSLTSTSSSPVHRSSEPMGSGSATGRTRLLDRARRGRGARGRALPSRVSRTSRRALTVSPARSVVAQDVADHCLVQPTHPSTRPPSPSPSPLSVLPSASPPLLGPPRLESASLTRRCR